MPTPPDQEEPNPRGGLEPPEWVAETEVKYGTKTTSICPFCGVGCGAVVTTAAGRVVNIEGDPDHPINQGALCPKGSALYQIPNNERRLSKVLHRAPGAADWTEVTWDDAIAGIAAKIKASRDRGLVHTITNSADQVVKVNRTENVALMGGSSLDSEEAAAVARFARGLGLVFMETQARL